LILLVAGRVAVAEDVEAIFRRGTELRKQGRDAEALAEFQRAARIQDSPRATAQIAVAEQALGSWVDAHTHLTRALAHPNDPWIQKNRAALDAALDVIETHLGQLEVWGTPGGAEVLVDDRLVGNLPNVLVWMDPGDFSLRVRAPGFADVSRTLNLKAEAHLREHIDLRATAKGVGGRSAVTANGGAAAPPTGAGSDPTTIGQPDEQSATDETASPIHHQWWFWTLIGVGIVAAGGAAWFLTHRNDPDTCTAPCTNW
jgi:hypothetical protein